MLISIANKILYPQNPRQDLFAYNKRPFGISKRERCDLGESKGFPYPKVPFQAFNYEIQQSLANPKLCFQENYQMLAGIWVYPNALLKSDKTYLP